MEATKVVIIDTQYVEADTVSFKSIVQRLTGKDCSVGWVEESSFFGRKTGTNKVASRKGTTADQGYTCGTGAAAAGTSTLGVGYGGGVSMLTKGLSFKDLDRMILEAPPMDELKWLWAD